MTYAVFDFCFVFRSLDRCLLRRVFIDKMPGRKKAIVDDKTKGRTDIEMICEKIGILYDSAYQLHALEPTTLTESKHS